MTELTRRTIVAGAAAIAAAAVAPLAAPSRSRAAAPPAGTQAPGWYRYKVGSIEVTVVTDGANKFKFNDDHVTNKKREEVNAALAAAYTVIISHYHGDHINGLLRPDKSLAFPNAEILVPAAEHKFFMDDGEMSRAPKGRMETVFKNVREIMTGEVLKRVK